MKKKLIALLAVMCMLVATLAGCGGSSGGGEATSAGGSGEATSSAAADSGILSDEEATAALEEMMPETCLSGFLTLNSVQDRSDVDKALPFKAKDPNKVVIGWTEQTLGDPWFVSVGDSCKKYAKEYGFDLNFDVADFDLSTQSSHIDSYISRGVDIIVVDPVDPEGVATDITRAVEAGIPVIGFGSEIIGAPVVTTIVANIFQVGFAAGKYVATQYDADEQINMGIILGRMGNTTAETRVNGMLAGMIFQRAAMQGNDITRSQAAYEATMLFKDLRKNGTFSSDTWKMACLGSGEGNWTFEGGIDIGETIVAANQDKLNLIIGENDFQGMGASQAVNNYGLQDQIKIASPGNGMKTELEKVKDGTLICDGPHNGWAFAMETMNLIKALNEDSLDVDPNNLPMMETFKAFNINPDTMDIYWDDDPDNLYHKTPPLEILDVPALKEKIKDGSYFEEWVPEE